MPTHVQHGRSLMPTFFHKALELTDPKARK